MAAAGIITGMAFAKSGITLMARIVDLLNAPVTQASFSSLSYVVSDRDAETTLISSGSLSIASTIFNTLQLDALWDKDSVGYNFRWTVPAAYLQNNGDRYQIDVQFTPVSGEHFWQAWRFILLDIYGSS